MPFDKRRSGLRKVRKVRESAGDTARLNTIAPRSFSPTNAGEGRGQRVRDIVQKNKLFDRTTAALNTAQNLDIKNAANVRADANFNQGVRQFNQGQENLITGRKESARRFDQGRSDSIENNRLSRVDRLMKDFTPGSVTRTLGPVTRGGAAPTGTSQPTGTTRAQPTRNEPTGAQPSAGLIRRPSTKGTGAATSLKGQYDSVAADFRNAGIDESDLYDEDGNPTKEGQAALQFMQRLRISPEEAAQRAGLPTGQEKLANATEALSVAQAARDDITDLPFGDTENTKTIKDNLAEAQFNFDELQGKYGQGSQAPQQQAQPRSFTGAQTAQPAQPATAGAGIARSQERNVSALAGQEGRVGNKNGVDGMWFKDQAGKQTFYSDNELKEQFPDLQIPEERSATGTGDAGDPITFRPKNITIPGGIQRPGGTTAQGGAQAGVSRGQASQAGVIPTIKSDNADPIPNTNSMSPDDIDKFAEEIAKNVGSPRDAEDYETGKGKLLGLIDGRQHNGALIAKTYEKLTGKDLFDEFTSDTTTGPDSFRKSLSQAPTYKAVQGAFDNHMLESEGYPVSMDSKIKERDFDKSKGKGAYKRAFYEYIFSNDDLFGGRKLKNLGMDVAGPMDDIVKMIQGQMTDPQFSKASQRLTAKARNFTSNP